MGLDKGELYQIGRVAEILGLSRRMVLNYEDLGLVKPDKKDEASGYRYYSADTIVHIKLVRSLQQLGLSLVEIRGYLGDAGNMQGCIDRLVALRDNLDENITALKQRLSVNSGDISWVFLERRVCYCREVVCASVEELKNELRKTYDMAYARGLKISSRFKIFTMRNNLNEWGAAVSCCIPVDEDCANENCIVVQETMAICRHYRGPYENIPDAVASLTDYAKERKLLLNGSVQNIFLEGPPTHGDNSEAYLTQVTMPVSERRKEERRKEDVRKLTGDGSISD